VIKPRDTRVAWLLVTAGMVAAVTLVLVENLGSNQLYALTLHFPGVDKVLHFMQSFIVCWVLGALLGRTGVPTGTRVLLAAAGALGVAGFDELQQTFRADRNIELADIAAGAAGVVAAVAAMIRIDSPRWAAGGLVVAALAGGAVTFDSYRYTRDYNRGVLAERGGRRDEALRHYLRGAERGIDNPELYNAAAWLLAESPDGDAGRAVQLAERSLQLRPFDADTLDTYGWSLYRALLPLQAALAAKPDIYCIHYHLGMVYLGLNRRDDAVRHLQQQVDLMPDTREARLAADTLAGLQQRVRSH
jgi:tetratricopeptide (TPR) repeat protein